MLRIFELARALRFSGTRKPRVAADYGSLSKSSPDLLPDDVFRLDVSRMH
jgi:hypothetical protein